MPHPVSTKEAVKRIVLNVMISGVDSSMATTPLTQQQIMQAALIHPIKFSRSVSKNARFNVICDSGASTCISFDKDDFVGPMEPVDSAKVSIKGISSRTTMPTIKAKGHVLWSLIDTNGMLRHLKLPALHVPNSDQRILSTSCLLDKYDSEQIDVTSRKWILSGVKNDATQGPVEVGICPQKNIPSSICYRYNGINSSFSALNSVINVTHESNFNLSEPQKEL
jgi:hypothetical protein